jgi:hypothetical protein
MSCQNCGMVNHSEAPFCQMCGLQLSDVGSQFGYDASAARSAMPPQALQRSAPASAPWAAPAAHVQLENIDDRQRDCRRLLRDGVGEWHSDAVTANRAYRTIFTIGCAESARYRLSSCSRLVAYTVTVRPM